MNSEVNFFNLGALTAAAAGPADRNIVLVTLDGVRVQELFTGMDPAIANAAEAESGIYDASVTSARYWRETPGERREELMAFFWKTLVPAGMVLGNPALSSPVTVRNAYGSSSPGYAEILTGEPQAEVRNEDLVRYPHETVLDYTLRRLGLKATEVAQIGPGTASSMQPRGRTVRSS